MILIDEDVPRFNIPMKDIKLVTGLDCIDQLDEEAFKQSVVTDECISPGDHAMQISTGIVGHDKVQIILITVHCMEAHDVGMFRHCAMQSDLPAVMPRTAYAITGDGEHLDSEPARTSCSRLQILSTVHSTEGSCAYRVDQLYGSRANDLSRKISHNTFGWHDVIVQVR